MGKVSGQFFIFLLAVVLAGCNPIRDYQAARLLTDVAAGTKVMAKSNQPERSLQQFQVDGVSYRADLYRMGGKPRAALLLLPGAAEKGKDDPRLQGLAVSMARADFAVLVPDLQSFRSLQIGSRDIGDVARCFYWLSSRQDLAPEGRAGLCAISYASGPAILAALQPLVSQRVHFIMTIGGYYDLVRVLTFFTTGYFENDKVWQHREPNHYGKWVFVLSNIGRLGSVNDHRIFASIAGRKLENTGAAIDDLGKGLSPEGRNFLAFIENKDPVQVIALIGRLPPSIREEIRKLNIANYDLRRLQAQMIILHGYDDDIIPFTESVALAEKISPQKKHLCLVHGLMHVNLKLRIADIYKLWRSLSWLLKAAEETSLALGCQASSTITAFSQNR